MKTLKHLGTLILLAVFISTISACGPSQEEVQATVQVAITQTQAAIPTNTVAPPTAIPTNTVAPPTAIPTIPFTPTAPVICPYAGNTDDETFVNLVLAEEKAVLTKEIDIIREIYAKDADGIDFASNTTYDYAGLIKRYEDGLAGYTLLKLNHFDFDLLKETSSTAWFAVSDSSQIQNLQTGEINNYTGGIAHIIFTRNEAGCWLISSFHWNAGGESFP